jgi:hypothetical protein
MLLDSAPSDSSDDSGQVLASPPSRLGGTADGNFGGISCCTFRSGLRSSSEHPPGYSLLPHLYQDAPNIAPCDARGQIKVWLCTGETLRATVNKFANLLVVLILIFAFDYSSKRPKERQNFL